jgi:hypothetical protein
MGLKDNSFRRMLYMGRNDPGIANCRNISHANLACTKFLSLRGCHCPSKHTLKVKMALC